MGHFLLFVEALLADVVIWIVIYYWSLIAPGA